MRAGTPDAPGYKALEREESGVDLTRLLATNCTVLSGTDQKTVAMLKNLIANIEAGKVTTLDRSGVDTGNDTAELKLILHGQPDISLRA